MIPVDGEVWSAALCANTACRRSRLPFVLLTSSMNRVDYLTCEECRSTTMRWLWGRLVIKGGAVCFEPDPRNTDEEVTYPGRRIP